MATQSFHIHVLIMGKVEIGIRGMKLKLSIHVHDISLYINCLFIVVLYNGKSGNWHLFLCYCRYFDKRFTEMFLE